MDQLIAEGNPRLRSGSVVGCRRVTTEFRGDPRGAHHEFLRSTMLALHHQPCRRRWLGPVGVHPGIGSEAEVASQQAVS